MTEQKPSFRRQSITLAVAAAVFALSGTAWGADYNRITTTIEDSSVDASVTYTEVTSPVNAGTARHRISHSTMCRCSRKRTPRSP